MQLEDVEVNPQFFEPLTQICVGRPRCQMFLRTWRNYMQKYSSESIDDIYPRIMHVISYDQSKVVESVTHSARIATSLAVWFGTNNGFHFMNQFNDGLDRKAPPYDNAKNIEWAISLWSIENSLYRKANGWGGRLLQRIIQEAKSGRELQPLTALENDSAETFMVWLATDEGWKLLDLLKRTSDRFQKGFNKERRRK